MGGVEIGLDAAECQQLELADNARQLFEAFGAESALVERAGKAALDICNKRLPCATVSILLVDYHGQVAERFTNH